MSTFRPFGTQTTVGFPAFQGTFLFPVPKVGRCGLLVLPRNASTLGTAVPAVPKVEVWALRAYRAQGAGVLLLPCVLWDLGWRLTYVD